jgi:asparagine synthase (glutamine-hydrolysing)
MCGVVALLSPLVPVDPDMLRVMRDRLEHRGPDSAGLWLSDDRRVGLGHRRLSIIDRSAAADQPMRSDDGELSIVYNGEIYNYVELRNELARLGYPFRTQSDTEVLLAAWQTWGEYALQRLNGMFAFALWDQARRQLVVARDRFGEKPLFLGRGRLGVLAVASEMKALLAHHLIPQTIRDDALLRYADGLWREDDETTFFEHIERLPPAHAAVFDAQGREIKRWRFWTPDYTKVRCDITAEEAITEFDRLFGTSIAMRLRSDVPVGSSLSGGLDSSTIVAEVARHRSKQQFTQNTFSACFPDDPTLSEEADIDRVVAHTDVHSWRITPTPQRLMEESRVLHWHQEEPFLSASIYLQWTVARLAKDHDTIVLLDGQGADEILGGYQSLFRLHQLDLLDRGQTKRANRDTRMFNRRLGIAALRFSQVRRRFNPDVAYSTRDLDDLADDRPAVASNPYGPGVAPAEPGWRMRRILSETLLYNGLPMLLRYADRNAMAFGRESRMPFLDHQLVDFCNSLPDEFLFREGWQKWILRKAAETRLPRSVAWRADKVGYAAPLDRWLRTRLYGWAQERIFDVSVRNLPGYDAQALQTMWNEHQSGAANHSWALWRWISLAEWRDLYDGGYWRCGLTPHQSEASV